MFCLVIHQTFLHKKAAFPPFPTLFSTLSRTNSAVSDTLLSVNAFCYNVFAGPA